VNMKTGKVKVKRIFFHAEVWICFHSVTVDMRPIKNIIKYAFFSVSTRDWSAMSMLSPTSAPTIPILILMQMLRIVRTNAGMIVMQYAKNLHRAWLKSVKPGYLLVQNDIFNNKNRRLTYENGIKLLLTGDGDDALWDSGSTWINFDESLGVALCYGAPSLSLYRPSKRQIGISGRSFREEMLYAEEVCLGAKTRSFWAAEGEIIVDAAFATATGVTTEQTRAMPVPQIPFDPASALRCASVRGADGRVYTLWANFGDAPASCQAGDSILSVIGTYEGGALAKDSCLLAVRD